MTSGCPVPPWERPIHGGILDARFGSEPGVEPRITQSTSPLGLLMNFHVADMKKGIKRVGLGFPGTTPPDQSA